MKIAFLGAGKMASALLGGMLRGGVVEPADVWLADAYPDAASGLADQTGTNVADSNGAAVREADVVVLCVKPGDVEVALKECGDSLSGKLIISIVSGLTCERLAAMAGRTTRIIRAMPNTPAQVGAGATALAADGRSTADDLVFATQVFESVGKAWVVKEELLDAVTGLSGSGPAYVCLILEALSDGGVAAGLPRVLASELATQTVLGAARMVFETGQHPALLREAVTSPGGTTVAALSVLEASGVRSAICDAVVAAAERSRDLGR